MNFLTYLYYKYYRFQVRVGNGDIALFSSIMFMACVLLIYYWGMLLFILAIFPSVKLWMLPSHMGIGAIVLSSIFFLWCWLRVWRKKGYNEIIKYYEKTSPKGSLLAILVPIIGFLLFGMGIVMIILRNNGII